MSIRLDENAKKYYSPSNYVQKYYEDLFTNLLEKAYDNSLISHNELFVDYVQSRQDISSYYVMTLSIIADSEEDIYYDMNDVYYSSKVDYAIGEDLDDIGDIVGCPRPQATKAGVDLTFTLSTPYEEAITLPADISVSTTDGITYETVESVVVPIGETQVNVYALSTLPGVDYRVGAETLTVLQSEVELISGESVALTVINEKSSSGGNEVYNDDDYRALILDWVKNNTKGSKEAFERYFASFDGLDSYKLVPNWSGSGTLKVILDPGYPMQLQKAYKDIKEYVCQFDDDITMFSPTHVPIKVYANCNVDIDRTNPYSNAEKDSIKTRIIDAIVKYINGDLYSTDREKYQGLKIGEDFIPYKLGVFVANQIPELKNIVFEYPTNPVTITDEEIGIVENVEEDINIVME